MNTIVDGLTGLDFQGKSKLPPPNPTDPRIIQAMRRIESNLHEPPSGAELAAACGLSEFHFNRLFRQHMGETLAAYSQRVRLDEAAIRLNGSSDPVHEIAEQLGYGNQSAFTRAFRTRFGMTPRDWRSQGWLAAQPFHPSRPSESGVRHSPIGLRTVPPLGMVVRRYFGSYEFIGEHWTHFLSALPEVLTGAKDTLYLALIRDDPRVVPLERIRYDCCIAPPDDGVLDHADVAAVLGQPGFFRSELRPGRYASLVHEGEYFDVGMTHDALYRWSQQGRYTVTTDPSVEVYTEPPPRTLEGRRRFTMLYPVE